jgi:glutathione S-transferase
LPNVHLYDYAASANCLKVRILLAQLELPYERIPIDIFAGETLTDEFAAINPARSTPVLETEEGQLLPESDAILWYLAEGTPFLPDTAFERAQVLRWLIFEQSDLMPAIGGLRFRLVTGRLSPGDRDAARRRRLAAEVLATMQSHLASSPFFVAERYSIADVALYAYTHVAPEAEIELGGYPAVEEWIARVEAESNFLNDLAPYPPNAHAGAGHSIYDEY